MINEPLSDPRENSDASLNRAAKDLSVREGTENFYEGSEPFFAYFTQTQVVLSTLRLTLDSRVIVSTSDLSSQMESARRGFQHSGNLIVAIQDVQRIAAAFRQRTQQWDREIQTIDRDKRGMNGQQIQRIKAEAAHIRGRIQTIDRAIVKLDVKLHQMAGEAKLECRATAAGEASDIAQA